MNFNSLRRQAMAVLLVFNSVGFAMSAAEPMPESNPNAVEQLTKQLAGMNTLTANFKQIISDAAGETLQQASGVITVKRPRRFYWRTDEPYEHLVVTDGKVLWLYDIDLEQITRQAFTADLDKAPALLLSGEVAEISRQYTVEIQASDKEALSFTLMPNNSDSLFKQLTISFKRGELAAMSLKDSFDQLTRINFDTVQRNTDIDDQLFIFSPPAGVDVIDNES